METKPRTFISYSSKDFQLVIDLVKHLESEGIPCWYAPRDIVPGKHYASSILDGIRSGNAFVIVFSKNSNGSEQCLKEVDRAVNAKKPIIPFRIDETLPTEAMDYYLCNTHWLNAYEEVVTKYYGQLVNALGGFINVEEVKEEHVTKVKVEVDSSMSRELQDVISTLRDEARSEEEEVQKLREEKELQREEREAQASATIVKFPEERTKQIIKQESKPLVIQAKKRRAKNKEKLAEEESGFERVKKKVVFPMALIAVTLCFYMYKTMVSDNTIKVVKKTKVKKLSQVQQEKLKKDKVIASKKIDYAKDFLVRSELEEFGVERLKSIRDEIKHRDGNLFQRSRQGLVESSWKEKEVQNYFLVSHILTEKSRPTNKGITSRLYLNIETEKEVGVMKVKSFWELGAVLVKEKLYDEEMDLSMLRLYPNGQMTSFPKAGELVVTLRFKKSKERKLRIIHSPNLILTSAVRELENFANGVSLEYSVEKGDSTFHSKELVLQYEAEYLGEVGFKSLSVQLMDLARFFVNSKEMMVSL